MAAIAINKVNELTIVVNDHDYGRETTYVTLGLFSGFCTTAIYDDKCQEKITLNQATPIILAMMIKRKLKEEYKKRTKINVNKNSISITLKTNKKKYDQDIYSLLQAVYSEELLEENLFNYAKENVQQDFYEKYSTVKFKSYLQILEFSDSSKEFSYTHLAKSIKKVTYNDVQLLQKYVVKFKNSSLFINGDIDGQGERFMQFILDKEAEQNPIQLVYPITDPYLETDMHLAKYDTSDFEMGCMKFTFFGDNISLEEKYILLNFIGLGLFKSNMEVSIDSFDSSIIYSELALKEYKFEIESTLEDEKVNETKEYLLNASYLLITNKPYVFNRLFMNLLMSNINYVCYLELLTQVNGDYLRELFAKCDVKITEAHIFFKEMEVSIHG